MASQAIDYSALFAARKTAYGVSLEKPAKTKADRIYDFINKKTEGLQKCYSGIQKHLSEHKYKYLGAAALIATIGTGYGAATLLTLAASISNVALQLFTIMGATLLSSLSAGLVGLDIFLWGGIICGTLEKEATPKIYTSATPM
jgi:hypothetical protein